MKTTTIRLTPKAHKTLKRVAAKWLTTLSGVIEQNVEWRREDRVTK